MTTADDTFAAFLDTLAETLDLGSEERAGLFTSRASTSTTWSRDLRAAGAG